MASVNMCTDWYYHTALPLFDKKSRAFENAIASVEKEEGGNQLVLANLFL